MFRSRLLSNKVQRIIDTGWIKRNGRKVPLANEVRLAEGAVELDATFLYADLANSSRIAKEFDRRVAAKILKSFLATSASIIKGQGGSVVSFDGDRILGVFVNESRDTSAAKCGMMISHVVNKTIRPKFEAASEPVRNASFKIEHGVGIDSGTVLAVRAGVRGDNDLVWVGRAPNLAAKLSDIREFPYCTFITAAVYNHMDASAKFCGNANMWEQVKWSFLNETIITYKSCYTCEPFSRVFQRPAGQAFSS